jgi:hypothetical protein
VDSTRTAIEDIDAILPKLAAPPTAEEINCGWTEEAKNSAHAYFSTLRNSLAEGKPLPALAIVRGLDHRGVVEGNLLEEIAGIANRVRGMKGAL